MEITITYKNKDEFKYNNCSKLIIESLEKKGFEVFVTPGVDEDDNIIEYFLIKEKDIE
ncbi:hypothetical protein [Clostridium sp.]|uniref:hypothetical protein n=1 Tax=Clostridium sp. TaxID=1506 RepID=UPI003F7D522E